MFNGISMGNYYYILLKLKKKKQSCCRFVYADCRDDNILYLVCEIIHNIILKEYVS